MEKRNQQLWTFAAWGVLLIGTFCVMASRVTLSTTHNHKSYVAMDLHSDKARLLQQVKVLPTKHLIQTYVWRVTITPSGNTLLELVDYQQVAVNESDVNSELLAAYGRARKVYNLLLTQSLN